ncbi:MAG: 3-phosphoshikimate 1-carboxyvinyltransferase [Ilumatobacteraceae bacterium]|nr:3-phosphoshikimate 1-carboxyvinyltransferase [Ilumatobacteraceae bacterium]
MAAHTVIPLLHPIDAVVVVPGSKSIANRALICAALAEGTSTFSNLPDGDDTEAMLTCLELLGIGVGRAESDVGSTTVQGTGGVLAPGPIALPTRLAGTTSRFITALAALGPGPYDIDGAPPLRARPMAPLHDALVALGASVQTGERWGHLPVSVSGPLRGAGHIGVGGDISSQFITALMLIGPYVPGGLRIAITTPLVSRPYLQITKSVMADFGHDAVTIDDDDTVIEIGAGVYRCRDYTIEPDASSASYPLAAAAICGGRVEVPDLTMHAVQGDARFCDVLASMGCVATRGEVSTIVESGEQLNGVDIDMVEMSDLVPTLAAAAVFATTATRIRGVGFIRAKESDRLGDLCTELRRLGAEATETDDGLVIEPAVLHGSRVATHHDHRLAMAFGLIGLRVADVEVDDPDVVSKSWPGYWRVLGSLR